MTSSMGQTNDVRTVQGQPVTGMPNAQQATGTPNHIYDLVSVIYHAMKSGAVNQGYIQDAQMAGDNELLVFFQQVQQDDRLRVQRAQQLLAQRLTNGQPTQ